MWAPAPETELRSSGLVPNLDLLSHFTSHGQTFSEGKNWVYSMHKPWIINFFFMLNIFIVKIKSQIMRSVFAAKLNTNLILGLLHPRLCELNNKQLD